jgi:hypothetical protein
MIPILPGIAVACEGGEEGGGFLAFENAENPFKVPTGANFEGNVKYTGVGETGALTVTTSAKFEDNKSACDGKSLKSGEKCGIKIKCNGAKTDKGVVTVHSPEAFVKDIQRNLECT